MEICAKCGKVGANIAARGGAFHVGCVEFPENFGHCFDTAGLCFLRDYRNRPNARLCHGIGIANAPGQEGNAIAHAWIEIDGIAYDADWDVYQPAAIYRRNQKVSYVVEYTFEEMWQLWNKTDNPGPWDEKIKSLYEEKITCAGG
jgi:hypothetical protein